MIILGLGYTTRRLAERLRARNIPVHTAGAKGDVVVHSVPPLSGPDNLAIRARLKEMAPRRIVYISSTGVYGAQTQVDENTPAAPDEEKGRARLAEEEWLARQAPTLILRSAAVYGPGRGIHVHIREGTRPRSRGGLVSRIHVDDLAALLEAALDSKLAGAWPVADNLPATSEEVAAWCWLHMGLTPQPGDRRLQLSGRSVDGRKIRERLGVELKYPDYRAGITASLLEEQLKAQR